MNAACELHSVNSCQNRQKKQAKNSIRRMTNKGQNAQKVNYYQKTQKVYKTNQYAFKYNKCFTIVIYSKSAVSNMHESIYLYIYICVWCRFVVRLGINIVSPSFRYQPSNENLRLKQLSPWPSIITPNKIKIKSDQLGSDRISDI